MAALYDHVLAAFPDAYLEDVYARCARERRPMYGGGMAELGVGRGRWSGRHCANRLAFEVVAEPFAIVPPRRA